MVSISITSDGNGGLLAQFPYSEPLVALMRKTPGWAWSPSKRAWVAKGPEVLLDMDRIGTKYLVDETVDGIRTDLYAILSAIAHLKRQTKEARTTYAYQHTGTATLALQGKGILADEMGLGKSKQSLQAAKRRGAKRVLIVAPKSLLFNWEIEVHKWASEYPATVYTGNQKERDALAEVFTAETCAVIVNYELLIRDAAKFLTAKWDVLICDEAHMLKRTNSKRHDVVRRLTRMTKDVFLLTGTPLEIRIEELFALMSLIRPAALGSYTRFRSDHLKQDGWGKTIGLKNIPLLQERTSAWITRRTKAEVLKQLPPKLPPVIIPVELSKQEEHYYQAIKNGWVQWTKDGANANASAANILTQLIRFSQLTSSPQLLGWPERGSKYEALEELITGWTGTRIIVFSRFRQMIDLLRGWWSNVDWYHPDAWITGTLTDAKERQNRVERFNAGELGKVLLGTDAMAFGLSINADLVVHYDKLWNPAKEWQREDRAHGVGRGIEGTPTSVAYLLADGTLDVGMHIVTMERADLFHELMDSNEDVMISQFGLRDYNALIAGEAAS